MEDLIPQYIASRRPINLLNSSLAQNKPFLKSNDTSEVNKNVSLAQGLSRLSAGGINNKWNNFFILEFKGSGYCWVENLKSVNDRKEVVFSKILK